MKEEKLSAVDNSQQLFELLLSNARFGAKRTTKVLEELSLSTNDVDIKETLAARVFLSEKVISALDQCFKLIGAEPAELSGRFHDVFIEEYRQQLAEIKSPTALRLFILATANQLIHLCIGEYVTLIAIAEMTGHCGLGVMLESCLAGETAFVERTRRIISSIVEGNGPAGRTIRVPGSEDRLN